MADSRLNGAERALQHSFRKFRFFNGLLMAAVVISAYLPLRDLPDRKALPAARLALNYRPVRLPAVNGPLKLAGAWQLEAGDRRFGGLSALAVDRGRFLAVSDRGAVARFDFPGTAHPRVELADLRQGPGPFDKKWGRDAESLARDPLGRGWWVGYEQIHSLWLYDDRFGRALARFDLDQPEWSDNRGAEGLLANADGLLVTAENGRDAIEIASFFSSRVDLGAGADVADAARAPDGRPWLLLRKKGLQGITQSIAPLLRSGEGFRAGPAIPLPKGAFDNFEGMVIEPSPGGGLRFWLITDDGHRFMARTLLVALDLDLPNAGHDKSPATGAGLSKNQQ
jgi:hypothetical protein